MDKSPSALLRGLGKFLAMVIVSVAVGAGLGLGLSRVGGDAVSEGSAPVAGATGASGSAGASSGASGSAGAPSGASSTAGAPRTTGTEADEPLTPRIRVLSSTFARTTATASDRRRRRGRVAVRLRVTARGAETPPSTARLTLGTKRLRADRGSGGKLLGRIPAGKSATGVLRFKTSGALTTRLASRRRATLRIGGRTLRLRLTRP